VLLGVNELAAMLGEEALYASLASLSPLTALAAWEATHAFATDELRIKWPNDLISARGKLAGILVESRRDVMPGSDTPDASDTSDAPNTPDTPPVSRVVIIGIGVNVNRPGQGASAVSAYLNDRSDGSGESAGTVGTGSSRGQLLLEDVAAAVINELLGHYERWRAAACSFAPFVAGYRAHMALMGEDVCVRDVAGSELARGIVEGIDDRARLILTGPRGSTAVVAGEVTLRDC
jgi:biotin-(acetyl-CoA carboxylase) ligase